MRNSLHSRVVSVKTYLQSNTVVAGAHAVVLEPLLQGEEEHLEGRWEGDHVLSHARYQHLEGAKHVVFL